ncbi:hypothetical protein BDQ12DRAFT_668602 [Crucibulum laeve]|uniref:Uncharacterized protein n=1 Tax=Crucibulum laeve TaxID=68775 RepID=A0A5C3LSE3_9AGAR|nr:hypothetical protein BDQ12DRAFT_668602 [Crucibulum laeve]
MCETLLLTNLFWPFRWMYELYELNCKLNCMPIPNPNNLHFQIDDEIIGWILWVHRCLFFVGLFQSQIYSDLSCEEVNCRVNCMINCTDNCRVNCMVNCIIYFDLSFEHVNCMVNGTVHRRLSHTELFKSQNYFNLSFEQLSCRGAFPPLVCWSLFKFKNYSDSSSELYI